MGLYARIVNGAVDAYPFNKVDLRLSRKDISWPQHISDQDAAAYGVLPVTEVGPPAHNPITHALEELTPVDVAGVWTQQWAVTARVAADVTKERNKARKQRLSELRELRIEKATTGGIFVNSQWYPCSTEARAQILWVLAIGVGATGQKIELLDGTLANLSFSRAQALVAEDAARMEAIATRFDELKTAIEISDDPMTVDIATGWPAVYVPV